MNIAGRLVRVHQAEREEREAETAFLAREKVDRELKAAREYFDALDEYDRVRARLLVARKTYMKVRGK